MKRGALAIGGLLLVTACGVELGAEGSGSWELEHIESDGALLSVWGSAPDDIWVAGGQAGRGLVLHGDGESWTRAETGATELLSWIYGFSANDVYAVGEGGLILHYDGVSWEKVDSGTDKPLYGIWGASSEDVWIVGGDPTGGPGSAVVLRGQGRDFRPVADLPSDMLPSVLYKIYGGPRGVIAVGSGGAVLSWDGEAWLRESTPTTQPLFSLWGRSDEDLYAVGGHGVGEVLHFDGDRWRSVADDLLGHGLSGVFTAPNHPVISVGASSYVLEIEPDGTLVEPELPHLEPTPELHGVWGDGDGTAYAVGGDLLAYPDPMSGVILRRR